MFIPKLFKRRAQQEIFSGVETPSNHSYLLDELFVDSRKHVERRPFGDLKAMHLALLR